MSGRRSLAELCRYLSIQSHGNRSIGWQRVRMGVGGLQRDTWRQGVDAFWARCQCNRDVDGVLGDTNKEGQKLRDKMTFLWRVRQAGQVF